MQSETCYADERGKEMSPEEVRQLLRRADPHERDALVRRLDKDARQTFKVRVTRRSRNRRISQNDAGSMDFSKYWRLA